MLMEKAGKSRISKMSIFLDIPLILFDYQL